MPVLAQEGGLRDFAGQDSVHNSTFDLAFHTWHDPLDRLADLAAAKRIELATPEIGEVLTVGLPRSNRRWWVGLK